MAMRGFGENRYLSLDSLMRGPVSEALQIPSHVQWGSQSADTFGHLAGDFMKPAVHFGKL